MATHAFGQAAGQWKAGQDEVEGPWLMKAMTMDHGMMMIYDGDEILNIGYMMMEI